MDVLGFTELLGRKNIYEHGHNHPMIDQPNSSRYWYGGLLWTSAAEPPSVEWLVTSHWRYWIALGPVWCLGGSVAMLALGLQGLLIGMVCWVVGIGTFLLAINVDVRHVRTAGLEWRPGVGRYTYLPVIAMTSLALAPAVMLVVGGVYLFQRRRRLSRAA